MSKEELFQTFIDKQQAENNLLKVQVKAQRDYIEILENTNKKIIRLAMDSKE